MCCCRHFLTGKKTMQLLPRNWFYLSFSSFNLAKKIKGWKHCLVSVLYGSFFFFLTWELQYIFNNMQIVKKHTRQRQTQSPDDSLCQNALLSHDAPNFVLRNQKERKLWGRGGTKCNPIMLSITIVKSKWIRRNEKLFIQAASAWDKWFLCLR